MSEGSINSSATIKVLLFNLIPWTPNQNTIENSYLLCELQMHLPAMQELPGQG